MRTLAELGGVIRTRGHEFLTDAERVQVAIVLEQTPALVEALAEAHLERSVLAGEIERLQRTNLPAASCKECPRRC